MTPRRLRRLMAAATMLCWLFAGGLIALSLTMPIPEGEPITSTRKSKNSTPGTASAVSPVPTAADWNAWLARQLQQPIYDPPPPPVQPPAPPPAPTPPQIQLVATMLDPSGDQAMIKDASGKTRFAKIGSRVSGGSGDAEVKSIADATVTVEYNGQAFEISLPR